MSFMLEISFIVPKGSPITTSSCGLTCVCLSPGEEKLRGTASKGGGGEDGAELAP